jgi:glucose-fructose oxidoreductase
VLANCTSSYGYDGQSHYRIVGSRGWFELEPATSYGGQLMRVKIGREIEERRLPPPAKDQFTAQLDHMSECVLRNKEPLVAGEEGLHDVRVMMAIYEAARSGKTVKMS